MNEKITTLLRETLETLSSSQKELSIELYEIEKLLNASLTKMSNVSLNISKLKIIIEHTEVKNEN